ncbi:tetratricopeptide repeat protein 38 family protein [Sulfitobacter alexandrii]|uniref:Tetratricopeptide repeat protein 38 n=1 Tax=Sulfitobacter alexandrii TaxID=1917485 RepID=A0A1J0WE71_9RHOB|nr:tetratricopeptide repeat protein [Sulfitobacter alexandrii]APE42603.1 tetratricopeptide repeat protein 38 family protein [Sulfitobacter alexandrii]
MNHDICDAPVALSGPDEMGSWNAMIRAFLAHKPSTPQHLADTLDAAPQFAMGHAARGLFALMLGRAEMWQVAEDARTAAHAAARDCPPSARERGWLDALDQWLADSPTGAVAALETVMQHWPQDTLSAKASHGIRFILGDAAGMRASVERVLPAHGADHPLRGYLMGCHAFTLEETGAYAAAERAGRAGLTLAPDDAWGLHAVAHVHDMRSEPEAGIALIETFRGAWDGSNNFRYHVWWHKALLHLDRGETDVALSLYDTRIRAERTDDYRDIANATSLLMRLQLEGVDVGDRWEELGDLAVHRIDDGCVVFADLHYQLALAGADKRRAMQDMAARFARDAAKSGDMAVRVADPGLSALAGLTAFSEGRYSAAFLNLSTARPKLQSIGGSHAQRDVFERMTIDAGLRAGHLDATEQILLDRLALRAGHADRFAESRLEQLSHLRRIPAQ